MKIAFFRGAAEDLIEAAEYYEMRQRGLGGDLAAEVQRVVALLLETPTLGEGLIAFTAESSSRDFRTA
jgi:hypothetical protein